MTAVYNPALSGNFIYLFFLMESAGKQNKTKRVGIYIQTNTEKSGSSAIFHYISVAT